MSLEDDTILITGAAGRVGRAVAARFAQAGARLLLVDRDAEALAAAFEASGQRVLFAADRLDAPQVQAAIDAGLHGFGRLGVFCHIAGRFRMGEAVHETTERMPPRLSDG